MGRDFRNDKEKAAMKYVIYTRISSENEKDKKKPNEEDISLSHEMQLKECLKTIGDSKYIVFHESNVSGDSCLTKRPSLEKALESIKKGDVFLVWKRDRLTREIFKFGSIITRLTMKGASLKSATEPNLFEDDHNDKIIMVFGQLAAEAELKNIRFRTKTALKVLKEKGKRVGYIPYGFTVDQDNNIIVCPEEQKTLDLMAHLYFNERLTYREVEDYLCKNSILNREGGQWSRCAIHRNLSHYKEHRKFYLPQQAEITV